MVCAFYPQLYELVPAGGGAAIAAGEPQSLRALLGASLWLVWHSQAAVMLLNGAAAPLAPTLRYYVHGQLLILLLLLRHNPEHCARHGQLQAAVAAVHSSVVSPALRRLLSWAPPALAARLRPAAAAAAALPAAQLCTAYLPSLQLGAGLLLPSLLVYRREAAQRRRFLAARGMRPEPVLLRREMGWALLAVALHLAAARSLA